MKIGLGLITYNRKEYFKQVAASIPLDKIDEMVVVNDGTPYHNVLSLKEYTIQNKQNLGVAESKNIALQELLRRGCDYIFLQEDDILIKNQKVFEKYIELHKETGIHHFNYALHGLMNKIDSIPNPRLTVNYKNEVKLSLYHHCVGAFSFYTSQVLNEVGLIDTGFKNAFDHVEHTFRIIKAHKHPPFWWFADLADSSEYLEDFEWSPQTSTVHTKPDFDLNFQNSLKRFKDLHNKTIFNIENSDKHIVVGELKRLYTSFQK